MAYTHDDYLRDLQIAQLGSGYEQGEAKMRVRLFEAGRYTQLEAMIAREMEENKDLDFELYEKQVEMIYERTNQAMQIWLNTPSGNQELWMRRMEEYEKIREEGDREKELLWQQYLNKKEEDTREKRQREKERALPWKVLMYIFIGLGILWYLDFCGII